MKRFFSNVYLGLMRFIQSRLFIYLLVILTVLLFIWFVIPNISIFGYTFLKSFTSRLITTLVVIFFVLFYFLYRKGWLSISSLTWYLIKRRKKNKRIVDSSMCRVHVRKGLKVFWRLLDKIKAGDRQSSVPLYLITGIRKNDIDSVSRHGISDGLVQSEAIGKKHGFNSVLSWKAAKLINSIRLYENNDYEKTLLDVIKSAYHRNKYFPLNGIVYTINVQDVLAEKKSSDRVKLESRFYALRSVLEASEKKYKIKLPIYFIFTGFEYIQGFVEHFSQYSEVEKNKPFGVTFKSYHKPSYKVFSDLIFHNLAILDRSIMYKLDPTLGVKESLNTFSFVQQLSLFMNELKFVFDAFQEHKYQQSGIVRGAYFVSFKQDNQEYDFLKNKVVTNDYNPHIEQKLYFIQNIFTKIITQEAYHYGENITYIKKRKNQDHFKSIICVATGLALSALWVNSYISYGNYFENVDNSLNTLTQNYKHNPLPAHDLLYSLQEMIQMKISISNYGLYYDDNLNFKLSNIYRQIAQNSFVPEIKEMIEQRLQNQVHQTNNLISQNIAVGSSKLISSVNNLYNWLSIYLMLNSPEHMDKNKFLQQVDMLFSNKNLSVKELQSSKLLLKELVSVGIGKVALNEKLVRQAQIILRQNSSYMLAYQNMKLHSIKQNGMFHLINLNNPKNTEIFKASETSSSIPNFFTKKGYVSIYLKEQVRFLKDTINDQWVLGYNNNNSISKAEINTMKESMDALYWNNYLQVWNSAINKISVSKPSNLDELVIMFNDLVVSHNPMTEVSKKIVSNTKFVSLNDVANESGVNLNRQSNLVTAQYKGLIDLFSTYAKGQKNNTVTSVLDNISKIRIKLNTLSLSNKPNLMAFNIVRNGEKDKLFQSLSRLWESVSLLPQPLQRWMQEMIQRTTRVVFNMAEKKLEEEWLVGPYRYYEQYLDSRYPIDMSNKELVNAKAFEDFFKKDGVLDTFINNNIKNITFKNQDGNLVWNNFYGVPFSTDPALLNMLNAARHIQNSFFSNQEGNGFVVTLTPEYISQKLSKVTINYQGKKYIYANGPQLPFDIDWPAENKYNGNILINYTAKSGGSGSLSFSGTWALFKMFQAGKLSIDKNSGNYVIKIYNNKQFIVAYNVTTTSLENPFNFGLFSALKMKKNIFDNRDHL